MNEGAGHEPDDNPVIWRRYILLPPELDISSDIVWGGVLLQATERLREMRHSIIHREDPPPQPVMIQLVIEIAPKP